MREGQRLQMRLWVATMVDGVFSVSSTMIINGIELFIWSRVSQISIKCANLNRAPPRQIQ